MPLSYASINLAMGDKVQVKLENLVADLVDMFPVLKGSFREKTGPSSLFQLLQNRTSIARKMA